MKFLLPISVAALAATVAAEAEANPVFAIRGSTYAMQKREAEAHPWCTRPGQSCWKAKREAEAHPWCTRPGQSCWKVRRAALAFGDALKGGSKLAAREANPEADALDNRPGGAAWTAKRQVSDLGLAIAAASGDPEAFYHALALHDEFPPDSEPEALTTNTEKRDVEEEKRWCTRPGQSCWKAKREAVEEAKRWCTRPGQSCWKAKRAAEAVINAIGDDLLRTRSADAEAAPWCDRPGQSCWKNKREASCNSPGGACSLARRDLHAMYNAARSILDEE